MAFIDNKNKRIFNKNKVGYEESKAFIYIADSYINNLILYTYSNNEFITKRNLVNLSKLINSIDYEKVYEENANLLYKFKFLKESIDIVLNDKVIFDDEGKMLVDYFYNEIKESVIPKSTKKDCIKFLYNSDDLTNKQVLTLTEFIESKLSYLFLYQETSRLTDILNRIKTGDDTNTLVEDTKNMVVRLNRNLSNVASMSEYANKDLSICDDDSSSDSILNNYLINKRKGEFKLKSGYWTLNQMINGGFQGGRVYMFFGPTKGFKSGTLLNLAVSICRYNSKFRLKDPDKKPCVVYFTQENSVEETVERLSQCVFGEREIKDWSLTDLKQGLRAYITDVNGVNLKIIYRPNKSVNTSYLYNICENLELENEECVCMIQDYVKRIRSTSNIPDLRIELGEVVNEFSNFAKEMNIPLITAGQLNREATRVIDNFIQNKRNNYSKALNASHIGESLLMLENTDYGIIVNREMVEETQEEYVSFKLIASRAKKLDKEYEYFAQPISSDGGFRIREDENLEEPLSVKNIGSSLEEYSSPDETAEAFKNMKRKSFMNSHKQSLKNNTAKFDNIDEADDDEMIDYTLNITEKDDEEETEIIKEKKEKIKIKKKN